MEKYIDDDDGILFYYHPVQNCNINNENIEMFLILFSQIEPEQHSNRSEHS